MKVDITENRALKVGAFVNLIMAIAGWLTYYFSNSEAMLLDGNFSFISALASVSAIIIAKRKHDRTSVFPFGSYVYESFFVFFKGILILGITIVASVQNTIKIIDYLNGENIQPINVHSILYYIVVMVFLCFGLAFYYKSKNKQINNTSSILSVEYKSSIIDGFLTLGVGIALLAVSIIPLGSAFGFLHYIGDAIIVLIMAVFLIKIPIKIIREAFIELGGGVLQDKESKARIEKVIAKNLLPEFTNSSSYITKLGSSYLIIVFITVKTEMLNVAKIGTIKKGILNALIPTFHTIEVEIVINE